MAGQWPAGVAPQWEPGQGQVVALVTWPLHSPLLLWISYLLPGPLLPPLPLLPLHSSGINKSKKVISPKGIFSSGQRSQARTWDTGAGSLFSYGG